MTAKQFLFLALHAAEWRRGLGCVWVPPRWWLPVTPVPTLACDKGLALWVVGQWRVAWVHNDLSDPPPFVFSLQEFEVIAQIKLLQSACNNYNFKQDDGFVSWFHSMERLSEVER